MKEVQTFCKYNWLECRKVSRLCHRRWQTVWGSGGPFHCPLLFFAQGWGYHRHSVSKQTVQERFKVAVLANRFASRKSDTDRNGNLSCIKKFLWMNMIILFSLSMLA